VFAEKISGAKANAERTELLNMVAYVEANSIDKVLVTELSRLGRDTLQVLEVIEMLNSKGISLYIQNYNIETLTAEGKVNPMSQFLITILAEVARMERKTIRERVASGYANFRANGGKVGRKQGYRKNEEAMRSEYAKEIQLLRKGLSLRNVSAITSTSVNTLRKIKNFVL
jgi:DNA invertase Pin-like site-specific DNA recombinase